MTNEEFKTIEPLDKRISVKIKKCPYCKNSLLFKIRLTNRVHKMNSTPDGDLFSILDIYANNGDKMIKINSYMCESCHAIFTYADEEETEDSKGRLCRKII